MRRPGIAALLLAGVVAAGVVAADRIGPAPAGPALRPTFASGAWLCPHGGGEGSSAAIVLANPGDRDVDARLTTFGARRPSAPAAVTVPAGGQLVQEVPSSERGSSTLVETFGGWIAAAWRLAGADGAGVGIEPCVAPSPGVWYAADVGTPQGTQAFLVVMNPFATVAVVDVVLFSADRAPVRDAEWTDLEIPPRRSVALAVGRKLLGEPAILAQVNAQVGRVGVGSLVVSRGGGLRSAAGTTSPSSTWYLPLARGAGAGELVVGVPGSEARSVTTTLVAAGAPASSPTQAEQAGTSAAAYPLQAAGPSAVVVRIAGGGGVVALRAAGRGADDAATAGTSGPAADWVVPPTAAGAAGLPGLVVLNPGTIEVRVRLRLLPSGGGDGHEAVLRLPAGGLAEAPEGFLEQDPTASVLVRADAPVVAFGAGRSTLGAERYAIAIGIPVPIGAIE
ncbi:MAG: hypothetical protein KatS3mg013_0903 [Actinomycetota bacterium]|jgi:hypothetical protein|nr:MAG: hypothetical protein KatS3mg013_0903 [Actinomycetota bacterium]